MRLVGIDPNKRSLIQACEVPAWVDGTSVLGISGGRSETKWFRYTQNTRRFESKTCYLAEQRERFLREVKESTGVDVKAAESGLRGFVSTAMDASATSPRSLKKARSLRRLSTFGRPSGLIDGM